MCFIRGITHLTPLPRKTNALVLLKIKETRNVFEVERRAWRRKERVYRWKNIHEWHWTVEGENFYELELINRLFLQQITFLWPRRMWNSFLRLQRKFSWMCHARFNHIFAFATLFIGKMFEQWKNYFYDNFPGRDDEARGKGEYWFHSRKSTTTSYSGKRQRTERREKEINEIF